MSADNGIYILKTKASKGKGHEYRVSHAQAIENVYYDVSSGEQWENFIPERAFQYFSEAKVLTDSKTALWTAHTLAETYSVLEYGVSILDHSDQVFQTFTEEQMEFYEAEAEDAMGRSRDQRRLERQKRQEAATIRLPAGTKIQPGYCHGVLFVTPEGEEVRGTLTLLDLVLSEDTDFLPNDWNK